MTYHKFLLTNWALITRNSENFFRGNRQLSGCIKKRRLIFWGKLVSFSPCISFENGTFMLAQQIILANKVEGLPGRTGRLEITAKLLMCYRNLMKSQFWDPMSFCFVLIVCCEQCSSVCSIKLLMTCRQVMSTLLDHCLKKLPNTVKHMNLPTVV